MVDDLRLCAISVDLDEIQHYHAIHGLAEPAVPGASAVYDHAVDRLARFARSEGLPLTFFAVASDLRNASNAAKLRAAADLGHEIANHSLDHLYDLTRRSVAEMTRQVQEASDLIAEATGVRPKGFRAPGYTMTDALAEVLRTSGVQYDSSVFPCPAYYAAKAATMAVMLARGRMSRSIVDHPRVLTAPIRPYRMGRRYHLRGTGLVELPIQVTRWLRLPFIGTSLTLAGPRLARLLARSVVGEPVVVLELHGIDVLDADDGLDALVPYQPDVRRSVSEKIETLRRVVRVFRDSGYEFVRSDDAAERIKAGLSG